MKIFRSESLVDYKTYTFNYATYCIKEHLDEIPEIYNLGFLPYSNNTELKEETYYLARSLRVNLSDFKASSENRRVVRKIEELSPSYQIAPVSTFDLQNPNFQKFCLQFAKERFSEPLSNDRLAYILRNKSISHIFLFTINHKNVGYVISIIKNGTLHYWFSFFSLDYPAYGLGKWMMFTVIQWAKDNGLEYVYLGTCYGEKSLYKVRDFKGLAFFDGNQWNTNMKLLKTKCKSDHTFLGDDFKQDTDHFITNLPVSS